MLAVILKANVFLNCNQMQLMLIVVSSKCSGQYILDEVATLLVNSALHSLAMQPSSIVSGK